MVDDKKLLREFLNSSKAACYNVNQDFAKSVGGKFCEVIFDGLLCWAAAPAGTIATQSCPNDLIKSKHQVRK